MSQITFVGVVSRALVSQFKHSISSYAGVGDSHTLWYSSTGLRSEGPPHDKYNPLNAGVVAEGHVDHSSVIEGVGHLDAK